MSEAPKRTPPRSIEVLATRQLSPHLVRVTFGGPELAGFGPSWPAAHLKLFFPRSHQTVPRLPTLSAEGRPVWPEAKESPVVRTYTTRRHDPVAATLDVEFVVHQPPGPAGEWALHARPGMRLGLAGPGGPRPMLRSADWYLLAGDLSALPAIAALLEDMPEDARGLVYVQLEDERDKQVLAAPEGVSVSWLIGSSAASTMGLVETRASAPLLAGTPQIWLAGENTQVVALRDLLLTRFPAARAGMYAVPYWKRRESEEQYHQERHRIMDELTG